MDPSLILGGLSGLAGLFSSQGGYQLPPGYGFANRMLKKVSRKLYQYSQGVPGSSPQELASLSSLHAMLGDQAGAGREQLLGALGPNAEMNPTSADALQRYASGNQSAEAAAQAGLMGTFLTNRQNALTQAAGVAQPLLGGGPQYMQNPNGDLSSVFGALAQAATTNRLLRQPKPIYGTQQDQTPGMERGPNTGGTNIGAIISLLGGGNYPNLYGGK